jgi:hypothetical protein
MNGPPAQRLTPRALLGRALLVIGSILFSLGVMELGLRLVRGWDGLAQWPNLVAQARSASWATSCSSSAVHDPRLGFVGRAGYRSSDGALAYDSRGLRLTPAPDGVTLAEPPILVLAGSFAHGDEVRNAESWPARLQALVKRRVVNAAMSGYGIDQMVLRAERVAAEARLAAIVMSFIADDVRRAEMRRVGGAEKPYFERLDGQLFERNVPVPPHPDPAATLDPGSACSAGRC